MLAYMVGILMLVHAAYSSYEHHSLTVGGLGRLSIPHDIVLETMVAIVIIGYAAIQLIRNELKLSIDNKVVSSSHTYLKPIEMKQAVKELELLGVSDFSKLENRLDFIDIKLKRQQFQDWLDN